MATPREYRAEAMKIAGFGLMAPMGTFMINLSSDDMSIFSIKVFIFFTIFLIMFCFGAIFINRGLEVTQGKN